MKPVNKACLLVWGMLMAVVVYAESVPVETQFPKDLWLKQVKQAIPEPICKSFLDDETIAAQMAANHISYDQCLRQIPTLAALCEQKYYASLPAFITPENAENWGKLLGECIGNHYAAKYLYVDQQANQAIMPET